MVDSLQNVKLYYFKINALGSIARMIMHHGKVKFENKTVTSEEWPSLKQTLEFKQMPILEVNGKSYSQSQAIYFFLCRKIGNLLGNNEEDEYQILSLLNCYPDLAPSMYKVIFATEKTGDQFNQDVEAFKEKFILYLSVFEKRYELNGEGNYYLGSKLSLADFWLVMFYYIYFTLKFKEFNDLLSKHSPKLNNCILNLVKEEPFKSFFESDLFEKDSF